MSTTHPTPATFFQRCCAWLFDVSLALWPASLLGWLMAGSGRRALLERQDQALEHLDAGISYIQDLALVYVQQGAWTLLWVAILYGAGSVWAEGGIRQATWGKRLMGISVAAEDGTPEDYPSVAKRFAAGTLSWLTLNLGHAMVRIRSDRRALHDLASGWRVIQEPMSSRGRRTGACVCLGAALITKVAMMILYPMDPVLASVFSQVATSGIL